MKSAGKARNDGLYRHIRTSKEIIRNLLNDCANKKGRPTKTVSLPYVCRIVNCTKGRMPFSMFVIYRTFFIVVSSHSLSSKSGAIFMVCKSRTPNTLPG